MENLREAPRDAVSASDSNITSRVQAWQTSALGQFAGSYHRNYALLPFDSVFILL